MAQARELVPVLVDSALALEEVRIASGDSLSVTDSDRDTLVYVVDGSGSLALDGSTAEELDRGDAGLVLAAEAARIDAAEDELLLLVASVGADADRHALLGARETVSRGGGAGAEKATGARSFQILLGPHNGSTRATLFAGFVPSGKAPWHYHLYDEIVWVADGRARLHIGKTAEELGAGSAFRLRPRQVHIVENLSEKDELTVIGIFTPAGSPSAAYLTPDVAAEYRFAGE